VFNNKGKPVRQYEPFFSATPHFEFAVTVGVASTTLYDPTGRTVGVLHPDHSYDKIVLDPWKRESWDVNDTVLENPQQDREIGPFIAHILESEYLPTWYEQRRDGQRGTDEREAALNTAAHARTPTQAFTDGLGRTFLSVAHNRRLHEGERKDEYYSTRTILDVQGNQRAIIDALDRTLVAYDYDLSGNPIHQFNADSGHAWALNDVAGGAVLSFDSRGHGLRRTYDALRRPAELFVRTGAGAERLAERIIYGETVPDAATRNLRGKAFKSYDAAGVVTSEEYDFKGNLLSSSRQLLANYRDEVDWAGSPGFEETVFAGRTAYDALSRPTILTAPDESAIAIRYSPANLLERLDVKQAGASRFKEYVSHVRHNARGQREFVRYGNGAQTASSFDPETFRLSRLVTTRRGGSERLQDLGFTYDPVGNFTSIADDAQATVYFKNQAVSARGDYRYDATYQLVEAQGREHAGSSAPDWNDAGVLHLPLPGDGQAMRRYRESYQLDAVGNLLAMVHSAAHCNWTRHYTYADLESRNRLTSTRVGEAVERYEYDVQGNTTRMPHLPSLRWNFKDQLVSSQARSVIHAAAETTYYVYDSAGQRVRKVTESQLGQRRSERIYLGGFERYREYGKESVTLERTTLHVMDGPRRLALLECSAGDCTVRYQFDDQIGSARLELDEAGGIISYEEYYPYGSTSYQAGRSVAEVSLKRYRFTGKERDEETGFSYHGARYYAPWLGRWTSCDPSGLKGGPNLFAYVRGNPITRSDPSGNWDISWTDVAIGAGAAILVVGAVALTAGLAAPAIAGGLAAAGVSAETISAVGTVAVAVGATAGVAGTAETATEVATGVNPVTHQRISDQQRSRQLGALPVQIVASALGLRGIAGGGSSGGSSFGELLPALESGLAEESTFGRFFAPNTSGGTAAVPIAVTPTATGALTGTVVTPIIVNAMSSGGGGGGGGGGNDGEKSSSGSAPEPAAGGESSGEATTGSSSSGEDVGARIRGLPEESQDKLLSRVVRGDAKGRAFGTPRNPRLPTVEEFNPRLENVRAGEVEELVTGTKHGINPDQASSISGLSNEDLVRFRIDDPISGARSDSGLSLTGGHHRVAEIISRVTGGTLDPDTIVQFLVHD
jgi:RHS repeat-associated protein